MLRFVLCDDEPRQCQMLEERLRQVLFRLSKPYEIALVTTKAAEVLRYARENPAQNIYLLDLVLQQGLDGLELCREIRRCSPQSYVLYVTAYPQYAMECCRTHPFDFILKPYSDGRLYQAIADLAQVIGARKPSAPLEVTVGSLVRLLDQREILYFKTDREYITAYLRDDRITWRESMVSLLGRVNADWFVRIHKSYAVNRFAMDSVDLSRRMVCLYNGERLPASRRFLSACETRGTATRPALGKAGMADERWASAVLVGFIAVCRHVDGRGGRVRNCRHHDGEALPAAPVFHQLRLFYRGCRVKDVAGSGHGR